MTRLYCRKNPGEGERQTESWISCIARVDDVYVHALGVYPYANENKEKKRKKKEVKEQREELKKGTHGNCVSVEFSSLLAILLLFLSPLSTNREHKARRVGWCITEMCRDSQNKEWIWCVMTMLTLQVWYGRRR